MSFVRLWGLVCCSGKVLCVQMLCAFISVGRMRLVKCLIDDGYSTDTVRLLISTLVLCLCDIEVLLR